MKPWYLISILGAAFGAVNWLLMGIFDANLIHLAFGAIPLLERLAYALLGLMTLVPLILYREYAIMYPSRIRV